jgi:acyl-CoA synthetase (AMP-forming)/AMP-acid ligase II
VVGGLATAAYLDAKYLIRHDLGAGSLAANQKKALAFTMDRFESNRMLMYHIFEEHANSKHADNLFLMFEGRTWTYKQFFNDIHRVANWLRNDLKVKEQEIVAIDGGNSPEYLMLWFGLEAIHAVPAFINCNLTAGPLTHSVKLCDARYLIADRGTTDLVQPCEEELKAAGITTLYYDEASIASLSDVNPAPKSLHKGIMPTELGGLIYTSGTTGLPKGVIMIRGRELNTARGVANYLKLKPGNRMYTCLPLYHGAAHGLCVTPSIYAGSTVVLSRKFSHKTLWPEVRASQADILQYVGELCRYLINAPPSPQDRDNNVRMAWGNGMRPDVWENFRQRFGIETINELYAATDGMGASFNANRGEFGKNAVGMRGAWWHWENSANEKRVRIDIDTEELLRNDQGFAIECKTGEPGEVLHKMDPETVATVFAGYYKNPGAGQKRFIRNVFKKDDLWFRSGDMMRQDADGCVYFVDRLGDTFRWRSENVSTNEVSDVLGRFDQIAEANVYGVQVPHADGRAGCAAIVPVSSIPSPDQLDLVKLAEYLLHTLPRYAVPIFLRVVPQLEYTGTMKLQKGRLRSEGVDLDKISASRPEDRMFWLPPGASKYEPFTKKESDDLKAGKVRL